jgi:hypothetical protein
MNVQHPKRFRPIRILENILRACLRVRYIDPLNEGIEPPTEAPPTVQHLSAAIDAYADAYQRGQANDGISSLTLISHILQTLPFNGDTWRWVLTSPLLPILQVSLQQLLTQLFVPTLECLASVLSYPPIEIAEMAKDGAILQFIPLVLRSVNLVSEESRRLYLFTLALLSRLFDPRIGQVFECITALACDGSEDTFTIAPLPELRDEMKNYLEGSLLTDGDAFSKALNFFALFVKRGREMPFDTLTDVDISMLYGGMAVACGHFRHLSSFFEGFDFVGAHDALPVKSDCYPEARKSLLELARALVRYNARGLGWTLQNAIFFGHPDSPDHGIAALDITKDVVANLWGIEEFWPVDAFCDWVFGTFVDYVCDGKPKLLRC